MSWMPTDTTCIRCTIARKRVEYHCLNVRINSGDDVATSCKSLVNLCWATPEIAGLICIPRLGTCIWRKSTYTSAFVVLPFRNAMEHSNADGRINSSNDQATPGINLVGFRSVLPKFTWINCVQQASINTWVSSSMLARWKHSCFAITCEGATLWCWAGYTLGFATHF